MKPPGVYDPVRTVARGTRSMTRTHGRQGGTDERAEIDVARRPATHPQDRSQRREPGLTTAGDPRLAGRTVPASGLLALQRSAGNAAVMSLVDAVPSVQRAVTIEEMETVAPPQPTAQQEEAAYGTAAPVTSDGGTTTIHGAHVSIEAPMTEAHGVLRADTIVADNVVASSYTPGAGNAW
jgi:hypothetical protein